jgi:putative spermidine/putrescine transport system ATP-binding protein
MSDRIAVFNHGKIEQLGRPDEIYDRPSTRFVAEFIGETNFIAGSVVETASDLTVVRLANGQQFNVNASGFAAGSKANISIRPERVKPGPGRPGSNVVSGTVSDVVYHGDHLQIVLNANGHPFLIKSDRHDSAPQIGSRLEANFSPHDCWVVAG